MDKNKIKVIIYTILVILFTYFGGYVFEDGLAFVGLGLELLAILLIIYTIYQIINKE